MKYEVELSGDFFNISNIFIEKRLPVKIFCTTCHEVHENIITLSALTEEHNKFHEKGNLIIHCKKCGAEMKLTLQSVGEENENYFFSKKKVNNFLIAKIVVNQCLIKDIPLFEFYTKIKENILKVVVENGEFSMMVDEETMIGVSNYAVIFN